MKDVVDIGSRAEPFVDGWLIEEIRGGASLKLHEPVRREVVLELNSPYEWSGSAYFTVFRDGDRIRMYHRGGPSTNYAESTDGIHFTKPKLGLFEVTGTKENNAVLLDDGTHNLFVFRDENPDARAEEQYKAIGSVAPDNLLAFSSPDGIHWTRMHEGPLDITGAFDSLNVAFWDPRQGRYRIFSRFFDGEVRAIQSCSSEDFTHWTKPVPHQYAEGVPREEFYTNATIPCPGAEHILLSFPKRFVPERTKDTEGMEQPHDGVSDAVFMSSRDGVHWDRPFMEAWVRPGPDPRNWTHRNIMPARGIIETAPGEWSMYVSEHYCWPTSRLRRVTVRQLGIASVNAGYHGGEFTTRPVTFAGGRLLLNYSTSAVGSVQVEVQDGGGKPIEGHALSDMEPLFGDEFDAAVAWKGGSDLSALAGRPVRFRFALKDADVFALRTEP